MDTASRSSKGFPDDDDDDDEDFGKREGSSSHKDLSVKVDGSKNNSDQKANTPRSKHSATEQRRRSKINERFQTLRDLIPHSDQKRDKASFLLEVIEYIQFLQEKAQKNESSYPGWSQENAKLMPWVKVFFRSFWKNARRNSHGPGESIADPSQVLRNGPAPGFVFSGDDSIPGGPAVLSGAQNLTESENVSSGLANKLAVLPMPLQYPFVGSGSGFPQPQQTLLADSENMASQPQPQWLRSCNNECSISSNMLNGQEELAIDEGTISLSSVYSQGLLTTLTQALQSSGLDLSQASLSVQINLGKRAISRPTSSPKDHDPVSSNRAVGHSRVGSSGDETEQANKRHKLDTS